jgi:peptide subunit release factor 1 (eRF1)
VRNVIGQIPVDYKHDSEQEILQRAERVWKERERREETKRVDQVVTAAKSAKQGELGVGPTLEALVQEKVRTLIIADGLAIDGSACTRCDYLSEKPFQECPYCGAETEQRDLADRAVAKAILTGADVEVIAADGARQHLLAEGGLGALLRY